jgi:hypothetical protein
MIDPRCGKAAKVMTTRFQHFLEFYRIRCRSVRTKNHSDQSTVSFGRVNSIERASFGQTSFEHTSFGPSSFGAQCTVIGRTEVHNNIRKLVRLLGEYI